MSTQIVKQRKTPHLSIGLQGGLMGDTGVLQLGCSLEQVKVFGVGAFGFQLQAALALLLLQAFSAAQPAMRRPCPAAS